MRKLLAIMAAALLTSLGITRAAEVTVDLFYKALEPQGEWFETADYGYVWHPRDVAPDWRPYTNGNWAYTDAGWTWISEEPFGWATYHYGRWANAESNGWVWVPDTEWGPAWVSWRRSPKHVGWAPLPPEARFSADVGIKTWSDSYYDIGPANYSFVEVRHFGAPRLVSVLLPAQENVTVIRETRNITNITVVNNVVYNGGPEYDVVVRESAEPVRRLRLERRTDIAFDGRTVQQDAFRTRVSGDTVQIAAPEIRYVPTAAPAKIARKVDKLQVDRGWASVKDRGQADQLRAQLKKESPQAPAGLPPQPKFERLADRAPAKAAAPTPPGGAQQPATATATPTTPAPGAEQQRATAAGGKQQPRGEAPGKPGTAPAAPGATVGTPSEGTAPAEATPGKRGEAKPGTDLEKGKGKRKGERQPPEQPATAQPGTGSAPGLTTPSEGQPGAPAAATQTGPGKKQKAEKNAAPGQPSTGTEPAASTEPKKEKGKQRGDKKGQAPEAVAKPEAAATEAATETTGSAGPGKPGRTAPPGRTGPRADRPERADKPEAPAVRPDRPDRPEAAGARPERAEQPQAGDRPGKGRGEKGAGARPEVAPERAPGPAAAAPGGQEERGKAGAKKGGKGERKGEEGAVAEPKQ